MCENCGYSITGSGYTNHCPKCLWCKHVDVNPGDRRAMCKGMMEPISVARKEGKDVISHRCIQCGFVRPNKAQEEDNGELILQLAASPESSRKPRTTPSPRSTGSDGCKVVERGSRVWF